MDFNAYLISYWHTTAQEFPGSYSQETRAFILRQYRQFCAKQR